MLYDTTVRDACFVEGRAPEDIHDVLTWAQRTLDTDRRHPWRLISARRKLGRILFEIEEQTPSGPRRLIGKLGRIECATTLYNALQLLRRAGFAPPALYTVPEPVVLIPERGLVLQEKVPGDQAGSLLGENSKRGLRAAVHSAHWLTCLHRLRLTAEVSRPDPQGVVNWAAELGAAVPGESNRIHTLANAIVAELDRSISDAVPSHGDFHPMNIFIAGGERITGIDIDKFALREPAADLGWFVMQTAAFDYFKKSTFACTEEERGVFIDTYQSQIGKPVDTRRIGLYTAMAFLKNLHFELVLLSTGRNHYAEPWLEAAWRAMFDNNPRFPL
jgi:hypothetical protein